MLQNNRSLTCALMVMMNATGVAMGAEMTLVNQQRTVLGDSNVIGPPASQQDIQEHVAPNVLLFDDVVRTSAATASGNSSSEAFQQSTIDACVLAAEGGFNSTAHSAPPNVVAYSVAMSTYRVTFNIDEPAMCRIVGTLVADEATHSRAILQQENVFLLNLTALDQSLSVAHQQELSEGQYTVTFMSVGTASVQGRGEHSASGTYSMRLATCFVPADLNIDGVVDVDDLLGVIQAWGECGVSVTCVADINLDGVVNVDDLLEVIAAWG